MIKVSAFRWVPPFARGLVRDLRVRWALEEAGQPYAVQFVTPEDKDSAAYRATQPFGQVPAIDDNGFVLFESAAIVLRIGEKSGALLPSDAESRSSVICWMFAAVNTIEPAIQNLTVHDLHHAKEDGAAQRRTGLLELAQKRLAALADFMQGREYLVGDRFSAADLLMTSVLRIPRHCDLVATFPALDAYLKRNEARPAFQRALAAQMADFEDKAA